MGAAAGGLIVCCGDTIVGRAAGAWGGEVDGAAEIAGAVGWLV